MWILSFIIFVSVGWAGASPNGQDAYWLRLLHYKKGWIGASRSLVDRKEFFLSPLGKHDPQAELNATIVAFQKDPQMQCRFPERYRYLTERKWLNVPAVKCPDYEEWKNSISAKSVTLVFASAYAHKPASLFGHTFLRFNSASSSMSGASIRDYGANFSAVTSGENAFMYVFKGVLGGYDGVYSIAPYYTKLNEYIFAENRNIWEYDLAITESQTNRMLGHLWELLVNSSFNYFYFDENCSYQILALLEVARPDWKLTDFGGYVVPLETLRALSRNHAITEVHFRPSAYNKLQTRLNDLSIAQTVRFKQVIEDPEFDQSGLDAPTLDAAAAYMFYKKQTSNGVLNKSGEDHFHRILVTRSLIDERSKPLPVPEPGESPEHGHRPYRLALNYGALGNKTFEELSWRLGVHDFLNSPLGYSEYSQFEGIDFRFRHSNDDNRTRLNEFRLFRATAIFPLTFLDKKPSYEIDLGCDRECKSWHAIGGGGFAANLGSPWLVGWIMARTELETDPQRGGVAGTANILSRLIPDHRTLVEFKYLKWLSNEKPVSELKLTHAYSLDERNELRAGLKWRTREDNESSLEWNWFF
jgi:hypothetical protein